MANQIPAKMRTGDIQRFVHRANQVEKFKPSIAYWCRYQALNSILSKSLQNEDNECMQYAAKLMDLVEEMKSQYSSEPAVVVESVAATQIQQFGTEVFERADKQMRSNSVGAQTADTLHAAVTFFDLLHIWEPMPAEVVAKVKYAKFHALRIAKALKSSEDPNATNPVPEPDPTQNAEEVQLDPSDPDVQRINNAAAYQPMVEDAPSENGWGSPPSVPTTLPRRSSSFPRPASAGPISPANRPLAPPAPASSEHPVSVPPSPVESNPRKGSAGGGYFPETVSPPPQPALFQPTPPTASFAQASSAPPPTSLSDAASSAFYQNQTPTAPLGHPTNPPHIQHQYPSAHVQPTPIYTHPSPQIPPSTTAPSGGYIDDDAAVAEAQKHARWAISALNFEDVPTAVKELRVALRALGAG